MGVNLGRGRVLPTSSWEAVWSGLLELVGIDKTERATAENSEMNTVLPNRANFAANQLFSEDQMFKKNDVYTCTCSCICIVFSHVCICLICIVFSQFTDLQ